MEENMEKSYYENNQEINTEVSLDEIINIIGKLKKDKATGLDNVQNECLQQNVVANTVWKLISKFF